MRLASQNGFSLSSSGCQMRQAREERNRNAAMANDATRAGLILNSISSELLFDPHPGVIRNQAQDGYQNQ